MKKYFVFLLLFGLIAAFIAAPTTISAKGPIPPTPKPQAEIWEWYGEGVTGEEIPMYTITTTPREWLQLKANGLKVEGATKICHGFDAGRYGWTGEIFRLVGDAWVKLPTTVGWVPTEEGHFMACAVAPAAGTYALFGYFDKAKAPVVEKVLPECDRNYWNASMSKIDNTLIFYSDYVRFYYPGAEGDLATFYINSNYPLSGDLTGTAVIDSSGIVNFEAYSWQVLGPVVETITFTYRVETPVCYFEWDLSWYTFPF